ncbi:MAG: hypothetical protein JW881_10955 [Spirochaetales bacterium]|nr:hypothetical protein [Spirochaetales bacterium]
MKTRFLLVAVMFMSSHLYGNIGAGLDVTFGPPWENDVELGLGVGVGTTGFIDILIVEPFFFQAVVAAHYINWNNHASDYYRVTKNDWAYEFAAFFGGISVVYNIYNADPSTMIGIYAEGGPEFNLMFGFYNGQYIDDDESEVDTFFGFAFGGGIVVIKGIFFFRAGFQIHIIDNGYVSIPLSAGFFFGF